MIQLENITYSVGSRTLFKDVSFQINDNSRIALIGKNGTGKTTLLRILNNEIHGEDGKIVKANYASIGYLPQENPNLKGLTLLDETTLAFKDVKNIENEIRELERHLSQDKLSEEESINITHRLGELHSRLEHLDGYSIEAKCKEVLTGLGFSSKDFYKSVEEFSGGWQMRIALAKLLLQRPWLIMMDEPTNHLDLDSLLWLENFLKTYDGAVLIISHDKSFLDNLTNTTLEITNSRIDIYKGNYSYYLREKELRKAQVLAEKANQDAKIKHLQEFVDRFKAKNTKATQAQSRVKQIEKIEIIEIEDEAESIKIRFPDPPKSGKTVLSIKNLDKAYGNNLVLKNISLDIFKGDKIGFVGNNGEGKSTLARIVAGTEKYQIGNLEYGLNVVPAYFGQHQAKELNGEYTVLETLEKATNSTTISTTFLRTLLGAFLFKGDDVFKKVKVLSGGEKSRLALAKILLSNANLLILDEPTNHLDIDSKNILLDALKNYSGTTIIISHDRDFLDPLINKVFEVKNKTVNIHLGNCSEYIERTHKEYMASLATSEDTKTTNVYKARKREEAEERQARSKLLKPLKQKLEKLEKEISEFENKKTEIESQMSDENFYKNANNVKETLKELNSIKDKLTFNYDEWEKLNLEIEAINQANQ